MHIYHTTFRSLDVSVGRWMQVDPKAEGAYGQSPYNSMFNNPISMSDPNGDFAFVPILIGAAIGAYSGHQLGQVNGASGWGMVGYMLGGAGIGGLSGGVGNAISTSGVAFSNTLAIAGASATNSLGMKALSGGQMDFSVSFGVGSFNFDTGELGYLGKSGNTKGENWGYGLANVSDALAGFKPGEVELQTENLTGSQDSKDLVGHSQLNSNGEVLIDFGPTGDWAKFEPGTNDWLEGKLINDIFPDNKYDPINIKGVNLGRIKSISSRKNATPGNYQVLTRSCSSTCSRVLTLSVVPAIEIHPYVLHGQMYLRNLGVRPTLFVISLSGNTKPST